MMTACCAIQQSHLGEHVHPALVGQREVEQHHVKGALPNLASPSRPLPALDDRVALQLQQRFQRLPDFRFVVNDEHLPAFRERSPVCFGAGWRNFRQLQTWTAFLVMSRGKSRVKVVPSPGRLSTRILPACSWMMP